MTVFDLSEQLAGVLRLGGERPAINHDDTWYSWDWIAGVAAQIEALIASAPPGTSIGLVTRNRATHVAAYVGSWVRQRPILMLNGLSSDHSLAAEISTHRPAALLAVSEDWERDGFREAAAAAGSQGIELGVGAVPVRPIEGLPFVSRVTHHVSPAGVAVILQTSGTTGPPKRIPLRLSDLAASVTSAQRGVGAGGESPPKLHSGTVIIAQPLGHMGAVFSICLNVAEGRRIVLMERFDPVHWATLVKEHDVKVLSLVPASMRMVLDAKIPKEMLAGARIARSGTAALPPELAAEFEETYGLPVLQNYGSTEFAGGVAGWNLAQWQRWGASKRGSVGTAVPGIDLRVVDPATGALQAPGERGVLEVRSPHTADAAPDTWVRTNDRAEIDADGFLWIRGRVDDVIVRGGFKIDANDVKRVIETHERVKEAVVVSMPDRRLGEVPVAAVVGTPGSPPPDPEEIRAHVRRQMEPYKVPTQVVVVDELPRNSAMKVQLPAVRALFARARPAASDGVSTAG